MKKRKIIIEFNQKTIVLLSTVLIIAFSAGAFLWVRAEFIEPTFVPGDSDQDFAQNILGG